MTTTSARLARTLAAGALLATPLLAQKDPTIRIDDRLRQFTGCWSTLSANIEGPTTCIVGTRDPHVIELLTVVKDSITSRIPIDASGVKVARTRNGCTGWERGTFSGDERRLFVQSELTCGNGPLQKMSSLYAATGRGRFSRIESLQTRGNAGVRVVKFLDIGPVTTHTAEIAERMPEPTDLRTYAAQVEGAAPLTTADVAEVVKALDGRIASAWLADRGQPFDLAANDLRAMHDAGVPPDVIDMMIALSNPRVFSVWRNADDVASGAPMRAPVGSGRDGSPGIGTGLIGDPFFNSSLYGYYGANYGYAGLYGPYGAYGNFFNPYASCNLAFNCYGGGWSYGGGGPYVILPQPTPSGQEPGSVIRGSGYSQGSGASDGRRAVPVNSGIGSSDFGGMLQTGGASAGSTGGVSTSTGGGGGAASSGAASGGEARTVKPRP